MSSGTQKTSQRSHRRIAARVGSATHIPMYTPLLLSALAVSLVAAWVETTNVLRCGVVYSAAVGAYAFVSDCLVMWRRGGIVGRLTVNFGMVFWFWLGALEAVFSTPPFPTPEKLYLGFASVVPDSVVAIGLICVNLFALMTEVGWQHLPQPHRLLTRLASRFDPTSATWIDVVALGLALLGWLPVYIAYQGDMVTALHDLMRMRGRGHIGAAQSAGLANHFRLLALFGGALAIARMVMRSPGFLPARYLAAATCIPLIFLSSSRFNLAFLFLPALLILLAPARHWFRWNKRRNIALVVCIASGALILSQGAIRSAGIGGRQRAKETSLTEKLTSGWVGHDHFGAMLIAIDLVEDRDGFFMEPIEPFFVTHFIPRKIWPDKPYPASWKKYNAAVTRGYSFNVTPSITGQFYMNWSYFGVVYIGLFIGWLARFCESWFARLDTNRQLMSATVAGLLLAFIFLSFRFFYPLYFAYPLFAFLAYLLLTRKSDSI